MTRYLLPLLFVLQLLAGTSGSSPDSATVAWDTDPPRSDPAGTKGDGPP